MGWLSARTPVLIALDAVGSVLAGTVMALAACDRPGPRASPTADTAPPTTSAAQPADAEMPQTMAPRVAPEDRADVATLAARHLLVPVEGMRADQLLPSFAQLRGTRSHEALDIHAPRGTPVLAVEHGAVAKLFTSKPGGLTIYQFDPTRSYAYYYAHLDRYADGLAEGQTLRRGQVIGYVGSTGNADPKAPHVHFAIYKLGPEQRWWQGTAIDPYVVFTSGGRGGRRSPS